MVSLISTKLFVFSGRNSSSQCPSRQVGAPHRVPEFPKPLRNLTLRSNPCVSEQPAAPMRCWHDVDRRMVQVAARGRISRMPDRGSQEVVERFGATIKGRSIMPLGRGSISATDQLL